MKRRSALVLLTAPLVLPGSAAFAQAAPDFPAKPVRIVVPTPAGGPSDTVARLLAQTLSTAWGQQVVVENRAGANGGIAASVVMGAPADGYTLLWAQASMAGLPDVQKSVPFKNLNELAPVSSVMSFGYALFGNRDLPFQTFAELLAHARAHPDKLTFATGTVGEYLIGAQVLKASGVSAVRVPYKGGAQLMPDLMSGLVQLNFGPISSGLQQVKSGKLKAFVTLLPQRSPLLPDVPSAAELGLPLGNLPTWNGLLAPASTPAEVIARISGAVVQAMRNPALRSAIEQLGASPLGTTPQAMADSMERATTAWRTFVREHDIPQE